MATADPRIEKAVNLAAEAASPSLVAAGNTDKLFSITTAAVDMIISSSSSGPSNLVASTHALYALGTVARRMAAHPELDFTAHHLIPRLVDTIKAQTKEHKTDTAGTALLCNAMKALRLLCESDATLAPMLAAKDLPHPQKSNDVSARVTALSLFPSIIGAGSAISADAYAYLRKGMEAAVPAKLGAPKEAEFHIRLAAMSALHKCLGPSSDIKAGTRRNRFETPDLAVAALDVVSKIAFDIQLLSHGGEEQMMSIGELLGHLLCITAELETLGVGGSASAAGGGDSSPSSKGGITSLWRGGGGGSKTASSPATVAAADTAATGAAGDNHGGYDFSTAAATAALGKLLTLIKANPKSIQGYVVAGCLATVMHTHLGPKVATLGASRGGGGGDGHGRGVSPGRSSGGGSSATVQAISLVWRLFLGADATDLDDTLKGAMGRFVVIAIKHWNEAFLLSCDNARAAIIGSLGAELSGPHTQATKHQQLAALHSIAALLQQINSTYATAEITEHIPHLSNALYGMVSLTGTMGTAASEALAQLVSFSPAAGHVFAEKLRVASASVMDHTLRGEGYTAVHLEQHRATLVALSKVAHALSAEAATTSRMREALLAAATAVGFPELMESSISTEERFADLLKRVEAFGLYFGCLTSAASQTATVDSPDGTLSSLQVQALHKMLWGLVAAFNTHQRPTSSAGVAACHRSAASLLHAINNVLGANVHSFDAVALTAIPFRDLNLLLEPLIALSTAGGGADESPLAIRALGEAFVTVRALQQISGNSGFQIDSPHLPPNKGSLEAALAVLYKVTAQGTQTPLTTHLTAVQNSVSTSSNGGHHLETGSGSPTTTAAQSLLGAAAPPALTIQTLLFGTLADCALPAHLCASALGASTTKAIALDAAMMCVASHFCSPGFSTSRRYDVIVRIFDILTELGATFEPGSAQQKTLLWNIASQLWLLLDEDLEGIRSERQQSGSSNAATRWHDEQHQRLAAQLADQLHRVFIIQSPFPEVRTMSAKALGALVALAGSEAATTPLLRRPLDVSTWVASAAEAEGHALVAAAEVIRRDPDAHGGAVPSVGQKLITIATSAIQSANPLTLIPFLQAIAALALAPSEDGVVASIVHEILSGTLDKLHNHSRASSSSTPFYLQLLLSSVGTEFVQTTPGSPGIASSSGVVPHATNTSNNLITTGFVAGQVHPEVEMVFSPIAASSERRLFTILSRIDNASPTNGQQPSPLVQILSDVLFRQHATAVRYKARPAAMHLAAGFNVPFHVPLFRMMEVVLHPGARDIIGHLITAHVRGACTFVNPQSAKTIEQVVSVCAQVVGLKPSTTVAGLASIGPDGLPLGSGAGIAGGDAHESEEMPEDAQSARGLSGAGSKSGKKGAKQQVLTTAEVSTKALVFELMTLVVKSPHAKAVDGASGSGNNAVFQSCVNTIVTLAVQADVNPQLQPAALGALVAVLKTFGQSTRTFGAGGGQMERPVLEDWSVQLFGVVRDLIRAETTVGEVPIKHMASFDGILGGGSAGSSRRNSAGNTPIKALSSSNLKSGGLDGMFAAVSPDRASERLHNQSAATSLDTLLYDLVTASMAANIANDSTGAKFAMALNQRMQHQQEHHQHNPLGGEVATLRALLLDPLAGVQLNLAAARTASDRGFAKSSTMFNRLVLQAFTRTAVADEDPTFNVFCSETFVAFVGELVGCGTGSGFTSTDDATAKRLAARKRLAALISSSANNKKLKHDSAIGGELVNTLVAAIQEGKVKPTPAQQGALGALLQSCVASGASTSSASALVKCATAVHVQRAISTLIARGDYESLSMAAKMLVVAADSTTTTASTSSTANKNNTPNKLAATSQSNGGLSTELRDVHRVLLAMVVERTIHEHDTVAFVAREKASSQQPCSFELLKLSEILLQLLLLLVPATGEKGDNDSDTWRMWASQMELAMSTYGANVLAASPNLHSTNEGVIATLVDAARRNGNSVLSIVVELSANAPSESTSLVGILALVALGRTKETTVAPAATSTAGAKLSPIFDLASNDDSMQQLANCFNAYLCGVASSSISELCASLERSLLEPMPNIFATTCLVATLVSLQNAAAVLEPHLAESLFKSIFKVLLQIKRFQEWDPETRAPKAEDDVAIVTALLSLTTVASVVLSSNSCFTGDPNKAAFIHKGLLKTVDEFGVQIRTVVAALPVEMREKLRDLMKPPQQQQQQQVQPAAPAAPQAHAEAAPAAPAAPPAGRPAKLSINIGAFK